MKTLVLGASGATGRLVVQQLINKGQFAKLLVRSTAILPQEIRESANLEIITGNVDDYSIEQFKELVKDCDSVVSCLGHNITFKGIFGKPRKLVSDAVSKVVEALSHSTGRKKFILMSTTAYTDKMHGEKETFAESLVFALLKRLLPPHADNVKAGDYLFKGMKESNHCEWIAVRPDSLIDEAAVRAYEVVPMKKKSPIFNPGKTSRIQVAHFMVKLLTHDELLQVWKYKAPVIYKKE
ncbi:SDR family oxidoreductase [bacterium]|nr:SDR family oxidoreductase [bacterium]